MSDMGVGGGLPPTGGAWGPSPPGGADDQSVYNGLVNKIHADLQKLDDILFQHESGGSALWAKICDEVKKLHAFFQPNSGHHYPLKVWEAYRHWYEGDGGSDIGNNIWGRLSDQVNAHGLKSALDVDPNSKNDDDFLNEACNAMLYGGMLNPPWT